MKTLLTIALVMMIASCKKDDVKPSSTSTAPSYGQAVFYKSDNSHSWSLIVDGVEYGTMAYSSTAPACGEAGFQTQILTVGKHTVDAKSYSGLAWGNPKDIMVIAGQCISVRLP